MITDFQVRETRRAVRDSERGIEKMAIGHHIHDRGHVIERKRDARTGEQEENQELINLDDGNLLMYYRVFNISNYNRVVVVLTWC